jgi:hypothetical protein
MRVAMPARLRSVAVWHVAQPPSPLKYASPACGLPTTMSPTVNSGEPRIVSLTRCRRKFASATTSSSVNDALGFWLWVGWPAFRKGPRTLPACAALRSKFVTFALMMLGPVSDPRAWEPWQSMQWLAHSARPRSCAA